VSVFPRSKSDVTLLVLMSPPPMRVVVTEVAAPEVDALANTSKEGELLAQGCVSQAARTPSSAAGSPVARLGGGYHAVAGVELDQPDGDEDPLEGEAEFSHAHGDDFSMWTPL
jgi:hypothetical protein